MSRSVASQATRKFARGMYRSAVRLLCALGLLFAVCACASKTPARRVLSISPTETESARPSEITVTGEGLQGVPVVALGSSSKVALRSNYRVQLLPGDHEAENVVLSGSTRLRFTPPSKLPARTYDVRVVPPLGAAMVLTAALTISGDANVDGGVDAATALPNARRLSLETRADGEGELIKAPTLTIGETLPLFAVFREPDGSLSTQIERVEFTVLPKRGELSEVDENNGVVFTAGLPGDFTLYAKSASGSLRTELAVSISSDGQHNPADYRLSLEDAPSGAGAPYVSGREYVAGKLLDVYAVVRDANDAFVFDTPVSWRVNGVERQEAQSSSLSLPLLAAGEVTLGASAEAVQAEATLTLSVVAGRATRLTLIPDAVSLRAGDQSLTFSVRGEDDYGNTSEDVGDIVYSLAEGTLSEFDAVSATLTPERVGTGRVSAESSYGAQVTSGVIDVGAGPLARLTIVPETLQLTADDPAVQFEVTGVDAFDNAAELGTVSWTVATGQIGALSSGGQLDPKTTGVGTIRASSSLGVSVQGGSITISGGRAVTLALTPDTWQGIIGSTTQPFVATGEDADGNATTDLGTLSFGVTGPIRAIDTQTGVFTPTVAGQGTVTVTSSYGPSVATRNILVSNPNATLTIQDFRSNAALFVGATTRMELDVRSNDVADVVLTGLGFTFTGSGSTDLGNQFNVVADNANLDRIAPGATQTLVYYLSVPQSATYDGTVSITARGEAFVSAGTAVTPSRTVISNLSYPTFGTPLTIDAPVSPADRACAGGRIAFGATASSPFTYVWRFPEGTLAPGSSLTDRYPSVDYALVGPKNYAVTATYTFFVTYPTTLVGKPVYIGTSTSVLANTYPTGRVAFSSPTADQNVALSSFPRSNLITLDPALPLRQCNNVAVDAAGKTDLTLFSDRKLIDPALDVDQAKPGIQVKLTAQGGLPSLPLIAPTSALEGSTTVYAEYFEPVSGKVTAAGDATFTLTGDTQAPSVRWSFPASDCTSACLKTRDPLVFQFSEPMWPANLSNVLVDLYSAASSCVGGFTDWTGSSSARYDTSENALYVSTPSRSGTYSVRVRVPTTVTDAATARNPLPALSRCVVFSTLADPGTPATPQLIAAPAAEFSPDGDGSAESVTWNVSADAATSLLRLRISRGGKALFGRLLPVTQAGQYSLLWDGADANGRVVNPGAYSYAIEAVNRAGVASTALRGYVEVRSAVRLVSLRRRQ